VDVAAGGGERSGEMPAREAGGAGD
jgi:hypothetical protein